MSPGKERQGVKATGPGLIRGGWKNSDCRYIVHIYYNYAIIWCAIWIKSNFYTRKAGLSPTPDKALSGRTEICDEGHPAAGTPTRPGECRRARRGDQQGTQFVHDRIGRDHLPYTRHFTDDRTVRLTGPDISLH